MRGSNKPIQNTFKDYVREKNMKTKDYLEQIRRFDDMIALKQREIAKQDAMLCSTPPTAMNPDKVQSSIVGDKMSDGVAKLVDAKREMEKLIEFYLNQKAIIVKQIESMPDIKTYNVLYRKYVLNERNCDIASALDCTDRRVGQLHKKAIREFEEKYKHEYADSLGLFV